MRRLARSTLNALTVLSLLLCAATAVIWVRSQRRSDTAWYCPAARSFFVAAITTKEQLNLAVVAGRSEILDDAVAGRVNHDSEGSQFAAAFGDETDGLIKDVYRGPTAPTHLHAGGFRWLSTDRGAFVAGHGAAALPPVRAVGLPWWCLTAATSALPAAQTARRLRRRQAARAGRCLKCHYDLTGNVSGVCPECGTEIPKIAAGISN